MFINSSHKHITERSRLRDSNMELLRLISMVMIVLYHFMRHGIFNPDKTDFSVWNLPMATSLVVIGFIYIGVNCFILLSGYYKIRFSWRGLCTLYGMLLFYNIIGTIIGGTWNWTDVICCFSHCPWWFMGCYVILYILSPLLNRSMENLSKREWHLMVGLLTIINVYFGYFQQDTWSNVNGYNVMHFIYMYYVGAYLKNVVCIRDLRPKRNFFLSGFLLLALLWGVLTVVWRFHSLPLWVGDYYNNPVLIAEAVCFFLYFTTLRFHSKVINYLAASSVAAYLLQDHSGIGWSHQGLYASVLTLSQWCLERSHFLCVLLLLVVLSVTFVAIAALFDKVRLFLFSVISRCLGKLSDRHFSHFPKCR